MGALWFLIVNGVTAEIQCASRPALAVGKPPRFVAWEADVSIEFIFVSDEISESSKLSTAFLS